MEIKICGLTRIEEAVYLNEAGVDYAGFVFFEKSKRNVALSQAKNIMEALDPKIKKAAVTVSPDAETALRLEHAGFDILQIHKELKPEVLEAVGIPVWYAFNISDTDELRRKQEFLQQLPEEQQQKITAIVVDGAEYGSGKTFDWSRKQEDKEAAPVFRNRKFILAGGLTPLNVAEGINVFHPDIVDVSSGVEGTLGKERDLILEFTERVRAYE